MWRHVALLLQNLHVCGLIHTVMHTSNIPLIHWLGIMIAESPEILAHAHNQPV